MKNAYAGIKNLYHAEIIQLIAGIMMLVSAIMLVVAGINTNSSQDAVAVTGNSVAVNTVAGAVLFIAGLVMEIIALIMSIIGIRRASKDEPIIMKALFFILSAIVAGVVEGVLSQNVMISNIAAAIGELFLYCSMFFVLSAIVSIAEKRSSSEVSAKAKSTRKMLMTIMVLSVILRVASGCMELIPQENVKFVLGLVTVILVLISLFLEVIQFCLYLNTLGRTKKLLEKNNK